MAQSPPTRANVRRRDVDALIFDSTPAGIIAAIALARQGRSALIVTEDRHVGGMQTSGLGFTNDAHHETVGGLAREFYQRIHRHYLARYGEGSPQVADCVNGRRFEPHVAERVYLDWLREAQVECWTEDFIVAVEKIGPRITLARLRSGRTVRARVFIDASYEGDLLALAGCSFHVGRESIEQYGEPLAGVRFPPKDLGKADRKVQAFDYRLCLTDRRENQVPFRQPPNYDPSRYAYEKHIITTRPIERLPHTDLLSLNRMPNRKTDSRSVKRYHGSWDWPEASAEQRISIAREHRDHAEGFIWFLLNDSSVPATIRDEIARWGYAADEFLDNDHWPYHLYVREARRLIGDWVMTQHDTSAEHRFKPDAVAIGSFFLDVHTVQILPGHIPEGGLRQPVKPYEIPYRVLLPRRGEADNLLVPVCMSASHVAFSSLRMEPVYQMLAHAAGLAAALALKHDAAIQTINVDDLRQQLSSQGQVLNAQPFTNAWDYR